MSGSSISERKRRGCVHTPGAWESRGGMFSVMYILEMGDDVHDDDDDIGRASI